MTTPPTTNKNAARDAGHTPAPWHLSPNKRYVRYRQSDGTAANICDMSAHGGPDAEVAATAAFIVRACNSHKELTAAFAALREIVGQLDETFPAGRIVRAALTKAGENTP